MSEWAKPRKFYLKKKNHDHVTQTHNMHMAFWGLVLSRIGVMLVCANESTRETQSFEGGMKELIWDGMRLALLMTNDCDWGEMPGGCNQAD